MESPRFRIGAKPYRVLLYYKYVKIDNVVNYTDLHLNFCKSLGIKGRIRIASEGINGTISGTPDQTEAYIAAMQMDPRFNDIVFKIDEENEHVFKRLSVKTVEYLVNFGSDNADVDPNEITGKHMDPIEFMHALCKGDVIVLDARNDYEFDSGHFKGAIRPDVRTFRELPRWIRKNFSEYKEKKVLTYCTGGIRCEKLTGFLIREGFKDVSQLRGGIISYFHDKKTENNMFEGKMYVFDERIEIQSGGGEIG